MKFAGQPLQNSYVSSFTLPRSNGEPLTLQLQPLSLGFHSRLRSRGILPPVPPLKVARDSHGKPLRDGQGMAITQTDSHNSDYLMELENYHQRVAVLTVVESLQVDPNITFDAVPPGDDSHGHAWKNYADAIFHELEQAGLTAGDLVLLCREICRLSNLLDQHLSTAQASFSHALEAGSA